MLFSFCLPSLKLFCCFLSVCVCMGGCVCVINYIYPLWKVDCNLLMLQLFIKSLLSKFLLLLLLFTSVFSRLISVSCYRFLFNCLLAQKNKKTKETQREDSSQSGGIRNSWHPQNICNVFYWCCSSSCCCYFYFGCCSTNFCCSIRFYVIIRYPVTGTHTRSHTCIYK